jgi:hypothetical protein
MIPNPFTSEALPETRVDPSEPTSNQPGSGFTPPESEEWQALTCDFTQGFTATNQVCIDEFTRRAHLLQDSGWTGVKYDFSKNGLYVFWLAQVTFAERPILVVEINGKELAGRWRGEGADPSTPCRPTDPHGHCQGVLNYVFNQKDWLRTNFAACQPGGDTFVVQVSGGGFNFRETGKLPADVFDCPTAESTPSASPTASPSSTPSASSPTLQEIDGWMSWTGIEFDESGSGGVNGWWSSNGNTITNGVLRVPLDAEFQEDTTILFGSSCSYLVNGTIRLGCEPSLPATVFANAREWTDPIPLQINIRNVGLESPESLTVSLSIQDSMGLRNVDVNFDFGTWEPVSP